MFIPAFTTNAMTSDFLASISPGWVGMFLDSHRTVFTFLSKLDLLGFARVFWFPFLKSSNYFQTADPGLQITQASKNIWKLLTSSDRDMSWNVWNRPSESFKVDMGISSNIMKSPSPKCYMTFWDMTIYNDTLNW